MLNAAIKHTKFKKPCQLWLAWWSVASFKFPGSSTCTTVHLAITRNCFHRSDQYPVQAAHPEQSQISVWHYTCNLWLIKQKYYTGLDPPRGEKKCHYGRNIQLTLKHWRENIRIFWGEKQRCYPPVCECTTRHGFIRYYSLTEVKSDLLDIWFSCQ